MRRGPAIALAAVAALLAAAAGAPADDILRPPGAVDHRGYELVSLADKGATQMHAVYLAPAAGDRVLYGLLGSAPGSTTGLEPLYAATRTATGWQSRSFLPPRAQMLRSNYSIVATTPGLSSAAVAMFDSLGNGSPDELLGRLGGDGAQTLLHAFPVFFGGFGVPAVASDDLAHVFADTPEAIDPSHQPGTSDVYDFGSGTPVLVSRLPGTGAAPACGVRVPTDSSAPGFTDGGLPSVTQHWASSDGSKVFFVTSGDDPSCSAAPQLYMRDLSLGATTLVSGPPVAADADNGVDRFLSASADGSQVYYRTATSLDPADDADGDAGDLDVYRWTASTGANVCVTCAVPNADVSPISGLDVDAVVSTDGSHLYFTSPSRLADAPSAGDPSAPNLYVWRAGSGQVHFVAQVNGIAARSIDGGEATPDGDVLIFTSDQPGLDALSRRSNGGFFQYYRYDDRDGTVTCLSCPSSGAPASDVSGQLTELGSSPVRPDLRAVTDDGATVFFSTADPLVPEDVNASADIYEWHAGVVKLITDGTTPRSQETAPRVVGASPDGRDFFFVDVARLTADAADDATKLYDARVDGGFPPSPAPSPPCSGDACHGAPSPPPSLPDAPSASLLDRGNIVPGSLAVAPIGAARRARFAKAGTVTLTVRVSGAGRVAATAQGTLAGRVRTVAKASKTARAGGRLTLALRLSAAARRQLATRGRLVLAIAVRYSEAPASRRLRLTLTLPLKRRGRP